MGYCGNCGTKLVEGATFCPNCGYKIKEDTSQSKTQNNDFGQAFSSEQHMPDNDSHNNTGFENSKKRKKKYKKIMVGVGSLVIIGIIIVAVCMLYPKLKLHKESLVKYENALALYEQEDFPQALEELNSINQEWTDQSKVNDLIEKIELAQESEKVKRYLNEDNLRDALSIFHDNIDLMENTDISFLINEAIVKFKVDVMGKVNDYVDAGKYIEAIDELSGAIEILDGDSELSEKLIKVKADYEDSKPINLNTLSPYVGELNNYEVCYDNLNNEYFDAFKAYDDKQTATYFLDGKYSVFNGTIAVTKAEINEALFGNNIAIFKVIADNQVIYEETLTPSSKPIDFSLNIKGVTDLTIEMKGKNTNLNYYNGLYLILGNAQIQK